MFSGVTEREFGIKRVKTNKKCTSSISGTASAKMLTIMFCRDSPVRKPICPLAGVISFFLLLSYPWVIISQDTITTPVVPLSRTAISETGTKPLTGSLILISFIEANPEKQ